MTGLENILSQITGEARQEADEKLAAAKAQADSLLEEARSQAEAAAKAILADGERRAQDIRDRASSAADLSRRNAMLAFKQDVIRATIDKVRSEMENAPDREYFDLLVQLAGKHARQGKAQLRLNSRDLARMPADFEEKVRTAAPQADISVSKEPADLESGFLLEYDGIDINCTFRALFEDAEGELRDSLSKLLFPGKEQG